jgi:hypothetical protein
MSGDPGQVGPGDVLAMERIFDLSGEEFDAVENAFRRDVRVQMEATGWRRNERDEGQ